VTLASPSRTSGRAIPPEVYPVVPAPRARLGLRAPVPAPREETRPEEPTAAEVPVAPISTLPSGAEEAEAARTSWWRRMFALDPPPTGGERNR
jgi:hypothetical protein